MSKWRFIEIRDKDIYAYQCLREVFISSAASAPIFLLEQPKERVTIGQKAIVEQVVHLDYCEASGIPIVRVFFPHSSSLYHYKQVLEGMVAIDAKSPLMTDMEEGKGLLVNSLLASLANLNLTAFYPPRSSNIIIGNKKVSAIGFQIKQDTLLFTFSLLLDFDYDRAEKAIISPKDMRQNLTTLREELGREVSVDEAKSVLKQGFQSVLGIEFVDDKLTEWEIKKGEKAREKYLSETWMKYGRWSPVKDYWRPN